MTIYGLCQRCGDGRLNHWTVAQAEFHIGRMQHWKVQLCEPCTAAVEQALLAALRPQATATAASSATQAIA